MVGATSLLAASAAIHYIHGFMLPSSQLMIKRAVYEHAPSSLKATSDKFALLFDCDGVIIETEELHRLAYNAAFKEFNLQIEGEPVEWSIAYYDVLQNTGEYYLESCDATI